MVKAERKDEKRTAAKEAKKNRVRGFSPIFYRNAFIAGTIIVLVWALYMAVEFPSYTEVYNDDKELFPWHPEPRPSMCPKGLATKTDKDSVTIIIPYLDEEWFRVQATMQSIIKYTDMDLVNEVMWVSDGSKPDKVFENELKAMHPKVIVKQNKKNLGLITTKMNAVKEAKGSILVFLEPHILVNPGWLFPLVNRLAEDPKLLIMPVLDSLDEGMRYLAATPGHWRFEWNLNILYVNPNRVEQWSNKPYMSPATSGGIYAIRKDWWDQLDLFDPELVRWGGDHVEASHKVWRCGGRIEIHPCSRVAHWFRSQEVRPYDVNWVRVAMNYKRLAEVWFDNYTIPFYRVRNDVRYTPVGDLDEMKRRREQLQCKDMSWYLKNVDLELQWEVDKACNPGKDPLMEGGCLGSQTLVDRMTSVTEYIPHEEYKRLMVGAEAFRGR